MLPSPQPQRQSKIIMLMAKDNCWSSGREFRICQYLPSSFSLVTFPWASAGSELSSPQELPQPPSTGNLVHAASSAWSCFATSVLFLLPFLCPGPSCGGDGTEKLCSCAPCAPPARGTTSCWAGQPAMGACCGTDSFEDSSYSAALSPSRGGPGDEGLVLAGVRSSSSSSCHEPKCCLQVLPALRGRLCWQALAQLVCSSSSLWSWGPAPTRSDPASITF